MYIIIHTNKYKYTIKCDLKRSHITWANADKPLLIIIIMMTDTIYSTSSYIGIACSEPPSPLGHDRHSSGSSGQVRHNGINVKQMAARNDGMPRSQQGKTLWRSCDWCRQNMTKSEKWGGHELLSKNVRCLWNHIATHCSAFDHRHWHSGMVQNARPLSGQWQRSKGWSRTPRKDILVTHLGCFQGYRSPKIAILTGKIREHAC